MTAIKETAILARLAQQLAADSVLLGTHDVTDRDNVTECP